MGCMIRPDSVHFHKRAHCLPAYWVQGMGLGAEWGRPAPSGRAHVVTGPRAWFNALLSPL